jgi:hypothetical protein
MTDPPRQPDFTDFVCTCDDDGVAEARALRAEVLARLPVGSEVRWDVTAENFVSAIVSSLNWDFQARVTGVPADQWFGVQAESNDGSFTTFVQCDLVEDGFAATWKAFADRRDAAGG